MEAIAGWSARHRKTAVFGWLALVFILSRIRELRWRGETTPRAITAGIASSAGVVSGAALIMVAVFSVFIGMGQVEQRRE